jgi:parallel beta-helix repeat protein
MKNGTCGKMISVRMAVAYMCVLSAVSWSQGHGEPLLAPGPCDEYVTPDVRYQELNALTRGYTRSPSGLSAQASGAQVYYVDAASSGGDGSSWQRAFRTLQEALSMAWSGSEIRVAQGVYKPGAYGGRSATFQLKNGVAIKGGYAGRNAVDPDARDTEAFPTILSGDLSGNDGPGFTNNYDNCLHVVTGSGTNQTAVLDGCTITGGNANAYWPDDSGAGMINQDGSSPTVTNCVFLKNSANNEGGAMLNHTASCPVVSNCVFQENNANWGGGMSNSHDCSPIVSYCTFKGNVAIEQGGGGLYNQTRSSPTVSHCIFAGNSAGWGGGMSNLENSSPMTTNCTFSENSVVRGGGGMYNGTSSNPTVSDCTFAGNSAGWGGGMRNSDNCSPTVSRCTFANNSAAPDNSGGGM